MSRRRQSSPPFSLFAFQDIITSITAIVILITMILAIELVSRAVQAPTAAKTINSASLESVATTNEKLEKEIEALRKKIDSLQSSFVPQPDGNLDPAELEQRLSRLKQQLVDLRKQTAITTDIKSDPSKQQRLDDLEQEMIRIQSLLNQMRDSDVVIYKPSDISNKRAWVIDLAGNHFRVFPIDGKTNEKLLNAADLDDRCTQLKAFLSQLNTRNNYFLILVRPSGSDGYYPVLNALRNAGFPKGVELIGEQKVIRIQPDNET